ncbi:MAG: hypothetical protein AB8B61_09225 [Cyclobacteriaceae bacterium]
MMQNIDKKVTEEEITNNENLFSPYGDDEAKNDLFYDQMEECKSFYS